MNDRVKIEGFVTISQIDDKGNEEILVERKQNHFVDQGLRGLLSYLLGKRFEQNCASAGYTLDAWSKNFQIYLGTDLATSTTHNLTALVSPIGSSPGTAPNLTSGEDRTNPSTGVWKAGWIAQWNPGTVSGTVGELALYLGAFTIITAAWTYATGCVSEALTNLMVSRLSAADSDFTQVVIDTSKSFVVHWEIQVSYT